MPLSTPHIFAHHAEGTGEDALTLARDGFDEVVAVEEDIFCGAEVTIDAVDADETCVGEVSAFS